MNAKKRETNYDLLRILCCLGVMLVHSNGYYGIICNNPELESVKTTIANITDPFHIAFSYFFHDCFYFAVPCFMMLSGAFLLSNNKNGDYKSFYKKTIVGTLVPTLMFSILYLFYFLGRRTLGIIFRGHDIFHIINYLGKVLCGEPVKYLWYMYTLLIICLFIPLIIKFKNSIGEDKFKKVSYAYIVVAMISGWTTDLHLVNWSIAKVACYIGYILAGYQIRANTKKDNKKGILFIISGFAIMSIMAYLRYYHMRFGIYNDTYGQEAPFALINLFGPFVCTSSMLIFFGFAKLELKENGFITNFAVDTFVIYLFHGFVIDIKGEIFKLLNLYNYDSIIFIPIGFILVLIVSIALTKIYNKIWPLINKNNRVDNILLNVFNLD